MLLAAKFFEILPEHNEYGVISQFFLFWTGILLLPLSWRSYDLKKSIECSASAVNVVSSNPFVDPLPRIKIPLFVLLICTDSSSYQVRK